MDVYAHRGSWVGQKENAGGILRENTLRAYARAFALGADGVEIDVRRTADNELVIHHDAVIDGVGPIIEQAFVALREARPDVPTFAETMAACAGKRCNVELKNMPPDPDFDPEHRIAVQVAEELAAGGADVEIVVSCFNLATIDRFREVAPTVSTGWLIPSVMDPIAALATVVAHGHTALHPNVASLSPEVARDLAARATDVGVNLHAWTVNDPEQIGLLARLGFAIAITDDVEMARRAVGS